jgi:aminoglycoside phosphotransferase (APT) family kinase protein
VGARLDERVKIGAVARAVETHLGVRPGRIVALPRSRSVWEVETSAGTVFLKSRLSQILMLEAWAYVKVREAGVPVPEVLAVEPHAPSFLDGYVITTKVPGIPLSELEVPRRRRRSLLAITGELLRRIHGVVAEGYGWPDGSHLEATGDVRGSKPSWSLAVQRRMDSILSVLERQQVLRPETVGGVRAAFERHGDALQGCGTGRLLHGDFRPRHVLAAGGGRTVTGIVDFEGMLLGDPVYDLAVFAFPGDDLRDVLAGYAPDEAVREGLGVKVPLYQLLRAVAEVSWGHAAGVNPHGMGRRIEHVHIALGRLDAARRRRSVRPGFRRSDGPTSHPSREHGRSELLEGHTGRPGDPAGEDPRETQRHPPSLATPIAPAGGERPAGLQH